MSSRDKQLLDFIQSAKSAIQVAPVRLDNVSPYGGWNGTNLSTGREVRIRTAAKLRYQLERNSETAKVEAQEMTGYYHKRPWESVVEYLKSHPEGVTGEDITRVSGMWQGQSSPTLKARLKALGYELVGEQLPGNLPGRPKCYKLKAL